MAKYIVYATKTINYEIEVEAENATEAYESLDDWIDDDFNDFHTITGWEFYTEEK